MAYHYIKTKLARFLPIKGTHAFARIGPGKQRPLPVIPNIVFAKKPATAKPSCKEAFDNLPCALKLATPEQLAADEAAMQEVVSDYMPVVNNPSQPAKAAAIEESTHADQITSDNKKPKRRSRAKTVSSRRIRKQAGAAGNDG